MIAIRSRVDALGVHVAQPLVKGLAVEDVGDRRRPRLGTGTRRLTRSNRHWIRETSSSSMIDSFGIVLRYDRTLPRHRIRFLPLAMGPHGLAAQFCRQRDDGVLRWPDERSAEIDRCARDRRRRRASPDAIAAFENNDVVPEPHQVAGRRQPREPGTHDDDVGLGWDGHVTRLSRREGHDSAVRTD